MHSRRKGPATAGTAHRAFKTTARVNGPPAEFGLKLLAWRAHKSGALRGHAAVEMFGGLVADSVPVFVGRDGVPRGKLPSHPKVEDGHVVKVDGKVQYSSDFYWLDVALAETWARAVGALVAAEFPEDLDP
jgi:hypothetical protein